MASNTPIVPVTPLASQQLASFKNQQLGGLLTGSDTGIGSTQSAALNALQTRAAQSSVGKQLSKTQDSVVAGAKRLTAIAQQGKKSGAVGLDGGNAGGGDWGLTPQAAAKFKALQGAAAQQGMKIGVTEGGRTRARQTELHNLYKAGKGNLAAAPGHSVHETGRAVDINGYGGGTNSAQFKWLLANAAQFGYKWVGGSFSQIEPWHWEYVG